MIANCFSTIKNLLPLFLIIALATSVLPQEKSAPLSRIKVEGNQFVDSQGNPVVFRGVSFSDPDKLEKEKRWNKAYFQAAKDWHANVVRFPVHPSAWRERGPEDYLRLIDQGVAWAEELGMHVIIDWHSIGNLRTEVFFLPMYNTTQTETFRFWQTIATRYAGNPTVAFYELFNEPTQYEGKLGKYTWAQHKTLMEDLIAMIYAINPEAIPLVAGLNWGYDLSFLRYDPIDFPGVAYVTHPYPQKRSQPWEDKWEESWGFAADTYPLMATEFGFMSSGERGAHIPVIGDESYGEAIIGFFDRKGISWTAWVFDPQWSPQLIRDWTFEPTRQGTFFRDKMMKLNNAEAAAETGRKALVAELKNSLQQYVVRAWYPRTLDKSDGGFLSDFDYRWQPAGAQNKMLVSQTRHVWSASQLALFYQDDRYREIATHGFRFLRDKMWDAQYGGFYFLRNRKGEAAGDGGAKTAYSNAFAIYALSAYFTVSQDPQALELAQKTFAWLDQHSRDPEKGGYIDILERDGSWSFLKGHPRKEAPWKDQNSSIHILEAYTALYQVWPDPTLRERLLEILTLIRDTITTEKGYLTLFLERDWTPVSFRQASEAERMANKYYDHVSFGHDVETAFLMLEAAAVLGMENDARTAKVARKMVDHALGNGWDFKNGGLFYQGYYLEENGPISIIDEVKTWWVQAEALNAFLLMSRLYPDEARYQAAFESEWRYIDSYLIDKVNGGWYEEGLDQSPGQIRAPKARDWKVNYHNIRALIRCIEMLEKAP